MLDFAQMTQAEQVTWLLIQDELLASRTMEEAPARDYASVCIERTRAYADKLATMELHPYLAVWAAEMTKSYGKAVVKVHHNYLPWIAAFLVSRYGEAVEQWPATLTEKDLQRAREWKMKRPPAIVAV